MKRIWVHDVTDDMTDPTLELTTPAQLEAWIMDAAAGAPRTFMLANGEVCVDVGLGDGRVIGLDVDLSGCGAGPRSRFTGGDPAGAEQSRRSYGFDEAVAGERIVAVAVGAPRLIELVTTGRRGGSWDGAAVATAAPAPGRHVRRLCRAIARGVADEQPDVLALRDHPGADLDVVAYLTAYGGHRVHGVQIGTYLCTRPLARGGRLILGEMVDGVVVLDPDATVRVEPTGEAYPDFESFLAAEVARARAAGATDGLDGLEDLDD